MYNDRNVRIKTKIYLQIKMKSSDMWELLNELLEGNN